MGELIRNTEHRIFTLMKHSQWVPMVGIVTAVYLVFVDREQSVICSRCCLPHGLYQGGCLALSTYLWVSL